MTVKISVVTPSYNSGKFIQRAIESVLNQSYANFEHIVIDGGSTDGTLLILNKYKHLKWISEVDQGQSDAMNKGFKYTTGELIVYLNADDFFLPDTFNIVATTYCEEGLDVIIGNLCIAQGETTRIDISQMIFRKIIHPFHFGFPYNPVCYFYHRSVQEDVGLFPIGENNLMDYWFLIRALEKRKVSRLKHTFGVFWLHEDCKSFNLDSRIRRQELVFEFLETRSLFFRFYYFTFYKYYNLKNKLSKK